jgi:hypothetical protein
LKVILIVDVEGLEDRVLFEKHLKKEGFTPIEGEDYAYEGDTTTHLENTKAYILDVVRKGLKKSDFDTCKIIFQIGENPMEAYVFNKKDDGFDGVGIG